MFSIADAATDAEPGSGAAQGAHRLCRNAAHRLRAKRAGFQTPSAKLNHIGGSSNAGRATLLHITCRTHEHEAPDSI